MNTIRKQDVSLDHGLFNYKGEVHHFLPMLGQFDNDDDQEEYISIMIINGSFYLDLDIATYIVIISIGIDVARFECDNYQELMGMKEIADAMNTFQSNANNLHVVFNSGIFKFLDMIDYTYNHIADKCDIKIIEVV